MMILENSRIEEIGESAAGMKTYLILVMTTIANVLTTMISSGTDVAASSGPAAKLGEADAIFI